MVDCVSGKSKIEATAQRLVLLIVRVCVCVRTHTQNYFVNLVAFIYPSPKRKKYMRKIPASLAL